MPAAKALPLPRGPFDGKPLLLTHKPQSAEDHSRQLTVGAPAMNGLVVADFATALPELSVWREKAPTICE
jgi:hypothetical protein